MVKVNFLVASSLATVALTVTVLSCSSGNTGEPRAVLSTATAAPTPVHTEVPRPTPALSVDPSAGYSVGSVEELGWAPPDDEATRRADLILIGTVDDPGEPFWTTVSGERPGVTVEGKLPDLPADQLRWGTSPQIFTPWSLTVTQVMKGQPPVVGPVMVNRWGGSIPPDEFGTEGEVAFVPGEEIVLFLKDCGAARAEKYGTPFRYIKRHVVLPDGTVLGHIGGDRIQLPDLLDVIEREKDQPPLAGTSCN